MRGLVFLILLQGPLGVFGQSLGSGTVMGPWDGQATWVRWATLLAPPVNGGAAEALVPGFSGLVSWEPFSSRGGWLGWTLAEGTSSTTVSAGGFSPGVWSARWWEYPFEASLLAPWALLVDQRWGGMAFGGARFGTSGTLRTSINLDKGTFQGQAWAAWGGWPLVQAFYGEFSAGAEAGTNLLLWWFQGKGSGNAKFGGLVLRDKMPIGPVAWAWDFTGLYGEGQFRMDFRKSLFLEGSWTMAEETQARVAGSWIGQEWRLGNWTLGLGTGVGLLWITHPTWSQRHDWTETTYPYWPFPLPVSVARSSRSDYTFTADPGWLLVVHPGLKWEPTPGWAVEVSRWVPLTGGWSYREGTEALQGPGEAQAFADFPAQIEPWNLWLAGTQVQVSAAW